MTQRKMWIFQANPRDYRLLDSLADESLEEGAWKVTRYKREICSGHIGLIWKCGKERGIYAVVDVKSNVQKLAGTSQEEQYWKKDKGRNLVIDRVIIHRSLNLRNTPVLENELVRIPHFDVESIFGNFRRHTNFKVEGNERNLILEVLNKRFGYVP
jgi:5-methylcytosine-specific restriction enzyme B